MIRNRWMFIYMGFYLILTTAFLLLSNDPTKVIISLTNIVLILTPLVGILFSTMYYYSSREFIELLLAQPLSRNSVFSGLYMGLAASLCLSLVIGVALPAILFGMLASDVLTTFLLLLVMAVILSVVFSLLAFLISMHYENRIKGFGIAIFTWLFFAIIYDGIFLLLLLTFNEYPLEKLTFSLTLLNPIDLARILIILKLDISAMMGYTGAVLTKLIGSSWGSVLIILTLFLWIIFPYYGVIRLSKRKDF